MPMKTTRPPGQIASNRLGATFWLPEHSNATSTPQPSVSRFTTSTRFCDRTLTVTAAPSFLASSSFASSTSLTITRAHPAARAASRVTKPIVPAPVMTAMSPGLICALVEACTPVASGSTIAACFSETLSGSLKVKSAGWTTSGRRMPCIGGVAQNRTAGSRL